MQNAKNQKLNQTGNPLSILRDYPKGNNPYSCLKAPYSPKNRNFFFFFFFFIRERFNKLMYSINTIIKCGF